MKQKSLILGIISVPFLLFAIIVIGIYSYWLVRTISQETSWIKTQGTITNIKQQTSTATRRGRRHLINTPVIKYFDSVGLEHDFLGNHLSPNLQGRVDQYIGTSVTVLYNPRNMDEAKVPTSFGTYFWYSVVTLMFGGFPGFVGIIFLIGVFRNKHDRKKKSL